ncbi:MAG: hypothetical protein U0132_21870 [Gemmatimonadaceae bacterium]
MLADTRRAHASFAWRDAAAGDPLIGDWEALLNDDALDVGGVHVSYLDVDGLRATEYQLDLDVWPDRRLRLTQLGRRFDTFVEELRRLRNRSRVAGLLAHGITMPLVFDGAWIGLQGEPRGRIDALQLQRAELQVYDTHLTMVPVDGDPRQLPFGAMRDIRLWDNDPAIVVSGDAQCVVLGQLGRQREALFAAIVDRREAQRKFLTALTGATGFSDGWGVTRTQVTNMDHLMERFTAPSRVDSCRTIVELAGGDVRFGFVQLLDPDSDGQEIGGLPDPWASFLLATVRDLTVLEILSGASAATYVFRGAIEDINRDLQLLHFRRAPLALSADEAIITPANPFRLALRRLVPLHRLRDAMVARIVHREGWEQSLRATCAGS